MNAQNILLLIISQMFLLSCNTQKPALPDTNRPPNLIEQLCSCTNSEGRTMEEAARLYQEEYGVSWETYLVAPPKQTEQWVRNEFFEDELYYNKLRAIAEETKKEEAVSDDPNYEQLKEEASQNYPFCAEQMSQRLMLLLE